MIRNFDDFCRELLSCGFSMGGGNAKGIFALIDYDWTNQDMLDTPVKWHCGDRSLDPWEWRMRVLEERSDIAYSKVFFKTSGFITKDWYPFFYAVRRNGASFEEAFARGGISHMAKRIYEIVSAGEAALHEIKALGGFGKEDKAQFDKAMVELQMGLYITMTGRQQKKNKYGIGYGWNSTVFTTVEDFWAERGFAVPELDAKESYEKIREQILRLNPMAEEKTIRKFIEGRQAVPVAGNMKLTKDQVQRDLAALPEHYKTGDVDRLIRKYVKQKADVSALRPYILSEQQFHRIYYYVTLDQIRNADQRMAFIHENLLFSDWWHTDQLISYVADLDFDSALRYAKEYIHGEDPFIRRWGYVLFISRLCRGHGAQLFPLMHDDEAYYVQMAQAWLIAELAIHEPEAVYEWFQQNDLKYNINGKAIQKICDSFRIAEDWKRKFKDLRPELRKRK